MKIAKIHFYTKYDSLGASSRVRTMQYLENLSSEFSVSISPLISNKALLLKYQNSKIYRLYYFLGMLKRSVIAMIRSRFRLDDLTIIEKELFPWTPFFIERLFLPGKFIIDADDAIYHNYDDVPWLKDKHPRLAAEASKVHVGNDYLASFYRQYNLNIEIIRTSINVKNYKTRVALEALPVIVWIGSPSTSKYLRLAVDALNELSLSTDFLVRLIGFSDSLLESRFKFKYEIIPWSESAELSELANCDIGIMPIPNDLFERGKCGYKLVQYLASGLLPVASNVGINAEIIKGAQNGILVCDNDWLRALDSAFKNISSHDSKIGYRFVLENFDVSKTYIRIQRSFKAAISND